MSGNQRGPETAATQFAGPVSTKSLSSFSDYLNLYRQVRKQAPPDGAKIRIAVLASFTVNGVKEVLFLKCAEAGLAPEIYVGGYSQHAQEALDPSSGLHAFGADLVIVFIDAQTLCGDYFFTPYAQSAAQRKDWSAQKLSEIDALVAAIKKHSAGRVLLHNVEVPASSPAGILEAKQDYGFVESLQALNAALRAAYKDDPRVFVFDYDGFCSRIGKDRLRDPKMYYLGDMKLAVEHIPALAAAYTSYAKPIAGLSRKCLVLDLDNTLWGGILGEDGLDALQLGPTPGGRPYLEFQKAALALSQRGVILALNSRNNADEALRAMTEHPSMVLKPDAFAAMRINWEDKAANLRAIAAELNIGLDSLVFIDDDKANRELVRRSLPEVLVVDLPDDPTLYVDTLTRLDAFETLHLTEEDRAKAAMYAGNRERRKLASGAGSLDDYLNGLGTIVTIRAAGSFDISRIAQLTQKTNQFNMTTRRYAEQDIRRFAEDPARLVISAKVEDRFGDNGICGAAIVETGADEWRIDTFLLSCRVIGRKVEEALLAHIVAAADRKGARSLAGEFIATAKNAPARDFYPKAGFKAAGEGLWRFDVGLGFPSPPCIEVRVEENPR